MLPQLAFNRLERGGAAWSRDTYYGRGASNGYGSRVYPMVRSRPVAPGVSAGAGSAASCAAAFRAFSGS